MRKVFLHTTDTCLTLAHLTDSAHRFLSCFYDNSVKASGMAAIDDDGGMSRKTNGMLSNRIAITIAIICWTEAEWPSMRHVWKPSSSGKSTQEVACNINVSVHNVFSILNQYICNYSYIDTAFIYILYNQIAFYLQCKMAN